jgi:hypothetical protein
MVQQRNVNEQLLGRRDVASRTFVAEVLGGIREPDAINVGCRATPVTSRVADHSRDLDEGVLEWIVSVGTTYRPACPMPIVRRQWQIAEIHRVGIITISRKP